MSASVVPSDLSNPRYGYDLVVAVTQDSVNATMLEYFSTLSNAPVTELYWTADDKGNPTLVTDNSAFLSAAKNTNPFSVPADTDYSSPLIKNLFGARFMFGVRTQIGLPHVSPSALQSMNVVQFDNEGITGVTFNLYCSTFDIVQLTPDSGWVPGSWLNISQDPNNPWVYSASVNLLLGSAVFKDLPLAVQQQIMNTGATAFSVQQLLFDLSNAGLQKSPTLSSTLPSSSDVAYTLNKMFCQSYFDQMSKAGQPILGYSAVVPGASPATMQPSSLQMMVNTYLDPVTGQNDYGSTLTTLNYVCNAGRLLPATLANFLWNWIPNAAAQQDHDGVVAINRSWFVHYFSGQLLSYVQNNCYASYVKVTYDASTTKVNYDYSLTPGQNPSITTPATGSTVLQYSYTNASSDQAGVNGALGKMNLSSTFTMSVDLQGNTIVITQHLVIYTGITLEASHGYGNIVDRQIVDTYTLAVDGTGKLVAHIDSVPTDNSQWSKANSFLNFFADVNSLVSEAQSYAAKVVATSFQDIPISSVQSFIFPGGKTFVFKGVGFSPNQDLCSYITYVTPS